MPVFPSQNLNTQKICESYPKLLQIYNGSLVLDGTGSLIPFLNLTSSYANYSISSSYANNYGNSITQSFSASNVWTFNHNLGSKYVIIQTVDVNDNQLTPEVINLFDDNTAIIGFSVPTAGTAIATRGGIRIFSSSYGYYNLQTGSTYPITSSWALNSLTASYALNGGTELYTGSTYPITSSWALTASYALNGGVALYTGSTYPITSSWSLNSLTASYALNGGGTGLYTGSTYPITSSWSTYSQYATYSVTASYALNFSPPLQTGSVYPITSSWSLTASYALNTGTSLQTGSVYPITSSWAETAGVSIQSLTSSYSIYTITASYALNCNCGSGSLYNSVTGSFVSSSTWVFTHNLQTRPVLVQAYDYLFNQIIPSSIVLTTDNIATLTFPVSESGFAIATRSGLTISGSNTSNCCLQTGSTYPITASYALNGGTTLYTGSIYPITSSWALNSNYAVTASYIGDSVTDTFVNSNTWVFNHNLQARPVLIQAYDLNYNQIVPQDIMLIDDNTALLAFPVMLSGFAIATRSGFRSVVTGTPMYTGSYYPITSSWAVNTQTSSYIQVTGVSYPVRRVYNNYVVVRTTDYTVLCDATSGEFNVKLPNPVGNTNIYNIKKIDTSGHRINVTVTNASLIDYELTQSIAHRGTNMMVQSDGTNQYWIL